LTWKFRRPRATRRQQLKRPDRFCCQLKKLWQQRRQPNSRAKKKPASKKCSAQRRNRRKEQAEEAAQEAQDDLDADSVFAKLKELTSPTDEGEDEVQQKS
jgi:hypothetical protein